MLGFVGVSLLICGGLLVYGSGRGFDLTDEVFYLIWASDPHAYALVYQPFGYLLHPLFQLVGRDVQAYRLAGFAIAGSAGAIMGWSFPSPPGQRAVFTVYGITPALTIFFPWIITPSYNSAANVGAMLIIGGLLTVLEGARPHRFFGVAAAGVGLCIAAFSKPPLFAIAAVGILLTSAAAKRARWALLASLVLAAALMCLFVAPGELAPLVRRIMLTQHILSLPNTPLALPEKFVRDWRAVPLSLSLAAAACALAFAMGRWRWFRWPGYAAIALSFYYIAAIVPDAIDGEIPDFLGMALLTGTAGYVAVGQHALREARIAVALLLAAPATVALGTFNNEWFQLNFSMAFPLFALFAAARMDPSGWRRAGATAFALVAPPAAMLLAAWAPYSLPAPIFDQRVAIQAPLGRGRILVDQETADFVAGSSGLASGAPLIDLSGTGPGVAAILHGRPPVLPWLNPATPSWPDVVWSRLSDRQREQSAFVVPVWPLFARSAPARWLAKHKNQFCPTDLPEMPFWGEERTLQLWQPCGGKS